MRKSQLGIVISLIIFITLFIPTFFCPIALGHKADDEDDTGASSGGWESNPYTEYDGGEGPGRCSGEGMPNYWVSTTTRELVVQDKDFSYKGLGPGISMTRTYNMPRNPFISVFGMFGDRWTFPYESFVDHRGQSEQPPYKYVWLKRGSGQRRMYHIDLSKTPPLEASLPFGVYDRLTWYGGYWLLKEKETRWTYRYDQVAGKNYSRLTSIADPDGNEVLINYNADETIQAIVDAAGRATTFHYDANQHCTSMTTPDGRTATYQYDSRGNLIRTVDLNGSETLYTYDAQHYMISTTAAGKTTLFDRAGGDIVQDLTDAKGNITQYARSTTGTILVTDPEGRIKYYTSTTYGFTNLNGYTDKDQKVLGFTQTSYANGGPAEFTDANFNILKMEYDTRGNLVKVTDPLYKQTVYVYDANDNLISKTNPLNETWNYEYDAKRHLIRVTSPMGNKTTMTYNELGQMTGITDANQNSSSFSYDDFGNLKTMTDPLGHKKRITYDLHGFIRESIIDERNNEARYDYDNNDRLVSVTHPDGTSKSYGYDCCAEVSSTDENGNKTTLIRDPLLLITEIKDSLGNAIRREYDKTGKLILTTDALGNQTIRIYDGTGRLTKITDPKGHTVQMGYDPNGKLVSLQDERGKLTSFAYNANGLLLSTNNPLGQKTTLTRDGLGRVVTATNSRGGNIGFTYDKEGRITRKSHGGETWADYGYGAVGNLTSVADSTGTTAYTYNGRQEVTGISYPDGKAVALSYDPAGNVSSVTYPGGLTVQYTYDSRNRVVSAAWGGNSVTYQYDGVGNLTREVRSNGTESTYVRDRNNRTTEIQHKKGTALFARMAYTRDGMGKITQETTTLPVPPVVAARSISASYNDGNQIIKWGTDNHTYDADGNLTSVTGAGSFSAVYDPENRLSEITQNGLKTTYTYDGMGNRTKAVSGSQTRRFYYDIRGRLLFEANQSGQIVSYYIYRDNILAALGTAEGGFHFYHFDKTGSAIALTDGSGNISAAYAYEPFGEVSNRSGAIHNPFTYAGALGVMEETGGIFFMRNRYYDARRGKFLQKDPIGIAGGENLYAYVGNNPIERVDPAGLESNPWNPFNAVVHVAEMDDAMLKGNKEAEDKAKEDLLAFNQKQEAIRKWKPPEFDPRAMWIADKVISYIPFIGNIYGLGKGLKLYMEGKYIESLKESLGTFPVIGMPISLGTDLGEWIYINLQPKWPKDVDWEGLWRGGAGGACENKP